MDFMQMILMMQMKLEEIGLIEIANQFEGDTLRDCLAEDYPDNLLQVLPKPLSLIRFMILSYTCTGFVCLEYLVVF